MKNNTCDKCPFAIDNNFKKVKGRGNIHSKLFIIGEAPGMTEKRLGKAFVGKAGNLLQSFIEHYNLDGFCYLTNAVKCRPPRNKTPDIDEILICRHNLINEFVEGKPKIIVLLGNSAVNAFYGKEVNNITRLNNKVIVSNNTIIMFGFHPSYILRNHNLRIEYYKMFHKIKVLYKYFVNRYLI